ncbi:hypothetical protein QBC40DRAFT_204326 [Triangularia verruculosa]|uniref:Uncharacterized protein n=1 Tax=Triangularia verruculosa TaxID=2587418 RepID=A0AAN7AU69_9PEZI|nr:hypothetical protein QBC40DRAFT_204326 [Triangularia verruculosa]
MMTPVARSESTGRQLIGPLTTVYTPSHNCRFGFVQSGNSDASDLTLDTIGYAYGSDCLSVRSCLPSMPTAVRRDYYSPGIYCPMGWETATKLAHGMTDSVRAIAILRALSTDETAAFCCPSGFTFSYTVWSSTDALPYCASTMIEGIFTYWTCNPRGYSLEQTLHMGQEITIVATTSDHAVIRATNAPHSSQDLYGRQDVTVPEVGTTLVVSSAITRAPAIQLVWRSSDLPNPANNGTADTNSQPINSTGIIVGAVVGAVVLISLIALGVWLWARKRRQKGAVVAQSTQVTDKPPESELASGNNIAELSTAGSPELPASPVKMHVSNTELTSTFLSADTGGIGSGSPETYELDTGTLCRRDGQVPVMDVDSGKFSSSRS